jgi:ATP-binding cassette, subfamily F, member 3
VKDGTVKSYDGDMEDYRTMLLAERGGRTKATVAASAPADTRADQRRAAAERRAELAPLKKSMQAAEKTVEKLTADVARFDAALADPALYTRDPAKAKQLSIDRGLAAKKLSDAEDAWLTASEAFETAQAESEMAGA